MLAIIVAITLTAVLGFPVTRYRASYDAIATVLAAVAIDALWRRWRERRSPPPGTATVDPSPDAAPATSTSDAAAASGVAG
jgi:ABC-type branched-subunit amino acid transport system permease subunit